MFVVARASVRVRVWTLMYAYHLHINYAHWTINQNSQVLASVRFVNTCICHQLDPGSNPPPPAPLAYTTTVTHRRRRRWRWR